MSEIERYPSLQGLAAINAQVNEGPYIEDLKQYGVPDHWSGHMEKVGGDCEDYAIAKANLLESVGWPRDALCLAIVYTEGSSFPNHGILVVTSPFQKRRYDEELLCLDNRFPGVMPLNALDVAGYRPFIIQTGGTLEWREWLWTKE